MGGFLYVNKKSLWFFLKCLIFIRKVIQMPNINDIHSIVVPAQSANLTAHTYTEVYGGSSGCTIVINGTTINVGSTSNFKIRVNTVSGGTGCYLLGDNQNVSQGLINGYYL